MRATLGSPSRHQLGGRCIGAASAARSGNSAMIGCRRHLRRAIAIRCSGLVFIILLRATAVAAVLLVGLSPRPAVSLPLYARQTGQPCATCHTAYLEL